MLNAGFDMNCLVMDFPRDDRCNADDWQITIDALVAATTKSGAKSCVVATLPENISEFQAKALISRGITPLAGIDESLDAIEAAAEIGEAWKKPEFQPVHRCNLTNTMPQQVLDEDQGKNLLSRFGINIPQGKRAQNSVEAAKLADEIGYPVVLKALGIAHKSEQNAVRLNLQDREAVSDAATELYQISGQIYIETMVQNPVQELLVGVTRDEQLGMVMTLASGGIMVEVLCDSQTLLLPLDRNDVEQALRSLKSAVMFDGFRGQAKADFSAAVETILNVQAFALDHCDRLVELDINPLVVCENGAIAADVLIRLGSKPNE